MFYVIGIFIDLCFRQAWRALEDMSVDQAMQEYVTKVDSLDPDNSWKVKYCYNIKFKHEH